MKKTLLAFSLTVGLFASAQTVQIDITQNGGKGVKTFDVNTLIDRNLGPGVRYTRLRVPDFPLNVNMLRIDLSNPYNSLETTQAKERLFTTEHLVEAAARQSSPGHVALAGANANFWVVSSQNPWAPLLVSSPFNASMKNGKIITDTSMGNESWNAGYMHTGVFGVTTDNTGVSAHLAFNAYIESTSGEQCQINLFNKLIHDNEITAFNSWYPTDREFYCVNYNGTTQTYDQVDYCATEVYLQFEEGETWSSNEPMTFVVKEIKNESTAGTVGTYDLVLAGRSTKKDFLNKLTVGEKVKVNYGWYTVNAGGAVIDPVKFTNCVGGNAHVMTAGELTSHNLTEDYNSKIYSRTGYGVSKDGKTAYIIVIDYSTDATYGTSAGCSTSAMCDIAKFYGCWDMTAFDAGGSAQMLVGDAIVNRTTEGSPRAVNNGMIVYSTAPEDKVITHLEFEDPQIQIPIYCTYTPRVYGFNQYGDLVDDNVQGFVLSASDEAGTSIGSSFVASNKIGKYTLNVSLGEATGSKEMEITDAQIAVRLNSILIDNFRTYPIEVLATAGTNNYPIDPSTIQWTVEDSDIATISSEGALTGHKNGTTTITGTIGDFSAQSTVTVEVPETRYIPVVPSEDISAWASAGTSVTNRSLARAGERGVAITYKLNGTRTPSVTVKPKTPIQLYSMPDSVRIVLNPGDASISKITIKLGVLGGRHEGKDFELTLTPNANNILETAISDYIDVNDFGNYPVSFTSIQMYLSDAVGTTHTISMPNIDAVYKNVAEDQGVEDILGDSDSASNAVVNFYNLQGVKVSADRLTPGIYIRVTGGKADKVLVQ